jgi:hypothetical protein
MKPSLAFLPASLGNSVEAIPGFQGSGNNNLPAGKLGQPRNVSKQAESLRFFFAKYPYPVIRFTGVSAGFSNQVK